jgi:hypothetical protein
MAMSLSGISIEPFRGDYQALEKMACSSWRNEYGIASFPNLYQPEYMKFLFDPIPDKRHLVAAYRGDEIVAFCSHLPRTYHYQGRDFRGVLSCLLVTRKEFLRKGMAIALIHEGLKLNETYHYDFALLYLEPGHHSTIMIEKLKQAGSPVEWVKRMHVVGRVLDLPRVNASEGLKAWERLMIRLVRAHKPPAQKPCPAVREYQPKDLEQCRALLEHYKDRAGLARVFSRDEAKWELDYPDISKTLVYEKSGKIEGLINWVYHQHFGKTIERWAWVNQVAWPELSGNERLDFVNSFLTYLKSKDCVGALEWTKKYYSLAPLYRAHFFPYFRAVNLISWNFNSELRIKNIPDVFEAQI